MFRFRTCLILVSFGFAIIFALNIFKSFPNNYKNGIHGENVEFVFMRYVLEDWLTDVHNYLVEEIQWDNKTFTKKLAECSAVCHQSNGNKLITSDINCATHPLLISDHIEIDHEKLHMPYAEATLPCFLKLTKSKIPKANRGIFTTIDVAKGILFGPYTGVIRSAYGADGELARDGGYAWRVGNTTETGEESDFYVDGADENNSNWLRYVNSARFEEEQNLYPLEFNNSIFYIVYKNVDAGKELLVWYGKTYANWMGIDVVQDSDQLHNWDMDFAPLKELVVCPTCELDVLTNEDKVNKIKNNMNNKNDIQSEIALAKEKDL